MSRVPATLAGLALAFAATTALAQPPRAQERDLSDGIDRTFHDYSGEGDASSIELNPALLNSVRGLDVVLRGYERVHPHSRGRERGS